MFIKLILLTLKYIAKMKKLMCLIMIMAAIFVSCSKEANNDEDAMLKKAAVYGPSTPITAVTPYIIPGENPGGNRTCEEVEAYFSTLLGTPVEFDLCGTKIDYSDGAFAGAFPDGLAVTTDGKYVSFEMDDCIMIDGNFYKVGAVIVKGSNNANVYYYPGGTYSDAGLSAPVNASGKPAGLSNITFCFIECEEQPKLVIALKSYMTDQWACTSTEDIAFVGYYDFAPDQTGNMLYYLADITIPVGNISVSDTDADGRWEVTIDNTFRPASLFTDVYLFVGTYEEYEGLYYLDFPYKTGVITPASSVTIDLPF